MNIHSLFGRVSAPFRSRRMVAFEESFLTGFSGTILDVGGAPGTWQFIKTKPKVVLLNLLSAPNNLAENMEYVQGDGCELPYNDQSIDIVFSNSVIEHLGTKERQQQFASEIRRVGRSYYVQTPNRWFPIEPHYLTPGVHFVPKRMRRYLLRNCTVWGWITRPTREQIDIMLNEIRLLDASEMSRLFPEATIRVERFIGLPKSLIAQTRE